MREEVLVPVAFDMIVDEVEALLRRSHDAGVSFSQAVAEAEDRFLGGAVSDEDSVLGRAMDLPIYRRLGESRGSPQSWRLDVDIVRSWWRGDWRLAVINDRQLQEAIVDVVSRDDTVEDTVYALGQRAVKIAYAKRAKTSDATHLDVGPVVGRPITSDDPELCADCGADVGASGEFLYMLEDAVWRQANPNLAGFLCIDCVERRLGRRLKVADFQVDNPCTRRGVKDNDRIRRRVADHS